MGDFLKCPRSYYLRNVYRDPNTRRKINIVTPSLALGQAVHGVLESLGCIPVAERFSRDLLADFGREWEKVSGKKGGFRTQEEERAARARGNAMIQRAIAHPGPLAKKTIRLRQHHMLPNFYLSQEEQIILCGKIDWIEYREEDNSIRIVDFKTGKQEENEDSLQLPIYFLLASKLQSRRISGAAYWYLEYNDAPSEVLLPDEEKAYTDVLTVARKVKEARETRSFLCPKGKEGCFACRPFEAILRGEAEYVGVGDYNQDLYMLP